MKSAVIILLILLAIGIVVFFLFHNRVGKTAGPTDYTTDTALILNPGDTVSESGLFANYQISQAGQLVYKTNYVLVGIAPVKKMYMNPNGSLQLLGNDGSIVCSMPDVNISIPGSYAMPFGNGIGIYQPQTDQLLYSFQNFSKCGQLVMLFIKPGSGIGLNDALFSPDLLHSLKFDKSNGIVFIDGVIALNQSNPGGVALNMEDDGNLVIVNNFGDILWTANYTPDKNSQAVLTSNKQLQIIDPQGKVLFSFPS